MQTIIEQTQPYVTTIVTAVLGVLVTVLLGAVALLKQKADLWFDARLSVAQRELLHKFAVEGFAFAQTVYSDLEGPAKLTLALEYASEQLVARRINISDVEIRAAIEDAYLKYKATVLTKL